MRVNLFLKCSKCPNRNYRTSKAKKPQNTKLVMKKYCRFCQKTQVHKEEIIK